MRIGPRLHAVGAAAIAATSAATARAQIVNVQPLVAGGDHDGFSGSVEASADSRAGNTKLVLLSGSVTGRYRTGRHLAFALVSGDYGLQADKRFMNKNLEHLRYRVVLRSPVELEAFAQHENDEFRRIRVRGLFGAGPRLHVEIAPMDFAIGVAAMFDLEQLADDGLADANETHEYLRISSYLGYEVRMGERMKLGYTLYAQPRADEPSDFRVLSETALALTAIEHFSLKVTLGLAYDSRPPASVDRLDAARKLSLQLTF